MKRRDAFLFFVLPFLGVLAIYALTSVLHQADLKKRTEALVREQVSATAGILRTTVAHLLDEGRPPEDILDTILSERDIYFVALLDAGKNILAWNSRYEGYLPISLREARDGQPGIIDSPAGKIFSLLSAVSLRNGRAYFLYMGYALTGMDDMIARSRRTSLLLAGLILLAGGLFFRGLYRLQSSYVTKAREAESERLEKERFREISAFTSGVAHEIKNPLNSLALVLELLDRKVPADAKGDVNLGRAQVRTISRIVDRFSRAVKAVEPEVAPLSLDEVLRQAVESLAAEVPGARRRVGLERSPEVLVAGDRDLLVQAVLNVLKNAVEASPDAAVRASGRRVGKKVEIRVRDEGPGLPPEAAARVFDPFFTTKERGMGIGLYLTKRIVEAHGGTIEARGAPGGGTEVRIEIPGA
ncbi:MAG TPA: HAMP domain-containing sensor histidine kinase [Candidatus Aminicenantes bacterium]|nr:HAMP domain-containing sensor histidine kinase [Candidatus Aminicenantes bacterium]